MEKISIILGKRVIRINEFFIKAIKEDEFLIYDVFNNHIFSEKNLSLETILKKSVLKKIQIEIDIDERVLPSAFRETEKR